MSLRVQGLLSVGAVAWLGTLACSGAAVDRAVPAGGAAGVAGASHLDAAGGGSAGLSGGSAGLSGGSTGLAADACLEHPTPQRTQGTALSLPLSLVLADKPFVFGQANVLADGSSLVPLNLRFYISELELLRASGEQPIAVDLVTMGGAPEPYGVHLFNAEDAASSTLHVLAPPGQYSGLRFSLGIKLSCNQLAPASLSDPLTDASQMTWPHTGGFLFLRYEGRQMGLGAAGASSASAPFEIPAMVHMGGNITKELVPRVTALGTLSVPVDGTLEKGLSVIMDEIFKGATADIDVSDVAVGLLSSDEAVAGERLRRQLPERHAFVLEP